MGLDLDYTHTTGSNFSYVQSVSIDRVGSEPFRRTGVDLQYASFFTRSSGQIRPIIIEKQVSVSKKSYIKEMQDEIKDVLSLSMHDLADACKVTRSTPYNWRDSEQKISRHKPGMSRLFVLSEIAKNWRSSGFVKPGNSLREPLVKGLSLFDLLKAEQINKQMVQFLGTRLSMSQLHTCDISDPFE